MKAEYVLSHLPAEDEVDVISEKAIDLVAVIQQVHDPRAGAVVLFSGEVRNHSHGKEVSHLVYEAYVPMARKMIREIIMEAYQKYKLHKAYCVHRVGKVEICESAVVVVTCSSHREEAYSANRYIIDRVKHEAPIWKQEYFTDGTSEWGHNCTCYRHNK